MDTTIVTSAREQLRKEIELADPSQEDRPGRKMYLTGFQAALQYSQEQLTTQKDQKEVLKKLGTQYNIEIAVQFFRKEPCKYTDGFQDGLHAALRILEEAC